jgi:hypothetical protein
MKKGRQHLFCPYCGGAISPKNTTCPHCGSDLSRLESQPGEPVNPKTEFREAIRRIPGTLYKPDTTFMEISQAPDFKGPLIIISILILIAAIQTITALASSAPIDYAFTLLLSSYLLQSILPTTTPTITQQILIISTTSSLLSITTPLSILFAVVKFIILWPIFAILYWLLSKPLGGKGTYKNTLTILAYAGTPQIIGIAASIIPTLLILSQPSTILWFPFPTSIEEYTTRLILWLILIETPTNIALTITLQIIIPDATLLWTGILIGYGLNHIHKIPKNKSLITGIIIPIILVAISLLYQTTIPLP